VTLMFCAFESKCLVAGNISYKIASSQQSFFPLLAEVAPPFRRAARGAECSESSPTFQIE